LQVVFLIGNNIAANHYAPPAFAHDMSCMAHCAAGRSRAHAQADIVIVNRCGWIAPRYWRRPA